MMTTKPAAALLALALFAVVAANPPAGSAAKGGARGGPKPTPVATQTPQPTTAPTPTPTPTPTPAAWANETFSAADEALLISLANGARANAGLAPLVTDSRLTSIARSRSKDMADRNYFGHTNPDGQTVFDIMNAQGYCYAVAAENIGWNNYPDSQATQVMFDMFMNSTSHRDNILGGWTNTGVGAYKRSDGNHYYTQLFTVPC